MSSQVKRVAVTGGAGQIAYSLLFRIAAGELFGPKVPIEICLRDLPNMEGALEGVAMELEDGAFPLLQGIKVGSDAETLYDQIDIALLIGAKPRGPGMERADLLQSNGQIFVDEGRALNAAAHKEVKVFVVGNPCNTNALIALRNAPDLNPRNFHAMMRLDQNRAAAMLAKKAGVSVNELSCLTIWGNHSTSQVPDFTQAKIGGKKVPEVITDHHWLQEEFMDGVQKRGSAVIKARGKSSAASAANALIEAVQSLYTPTPKGTWFTSGVLTDHNPYGLEENLVFGLPCRSKGDGDYEIVENVEWDFFIKEKIAVTQKELISERECIASLL